MKKRAILSIVLGFVVLASGAFASQNRGTDDAPTALSKGVHKAESDDTETPVARRDAERAARAALEATGGGTVHDVDRDVEGGAAWEVEITLPDGKAVDVLLDSEFRVLSIGDEQEANERTDDADDRDDDDSDDD